MNLTNDIVNRDELYEDYAKGVAIMSVTFTLNPIIHTYRCKRQRLLTEKTLCEVIQLYCHRAVVVPELHVKPNVHYHGVISLREASDADMIVDSLKSKKYFGNTFVNTKLITDKPSFMRTIEYIVKDMPRSKRLLDDDDIVSLINGYKPKKYKIEYATDKLDKFVSIEEWLENFEKRDNINCENKPPPGEVRGVCLSEETLNNF